MRVLLVVRGDAGSRPGSDLLRAQLLARSLRELSVDATLVTADAPAAHGYDVAHLFGAGDARCAGRIAAVRAAGVPIVLSPLWVGAQPADAGGPDDRDLQRAVVRSLLLAADVVIASSEIEAYLYGARLHVPRIAYVVAPLGVDDDAFAVDRPEKRTGVLCAGRVAPRQNQALLLEALRDIDVDVTIAGEASDADYLARCRAAATPRTRFVERIAHAELLRLMSHAAVHARPAWFDLPSLSALEAAATGARIVSGDLGCEREYFGPHADYADPGDPLSIRAAVVDALERPPRDRGDALDRRLGKHTWDRHAEVTLDAYARAMVLGTR